MTGHPYSIHKQSFPVWDANLAAEEQYSLVIQVNGKLRDKVLVPVSITEPEAREIALSQPRVMAYTQGKEVTKFIYVPGKLVNLVVR